MTRLDGSPNTVPSAHVTQDRTAPKQVAIQNRDPR